MMQNIVFICVAIARR